MQNESLFETFYFLKGTQCFIINIIIIICMVHFEFRSKKYRRYFNLSVLQISF